MNRFMPVLAGLTMAAGVAASPAAAQGFNAGGQAAGQEKIDTAAINRIKEEGFQRSQIMDIMSWLTDVYGPRLTASPITKRAGDWTLSQFNKWGLSNAHYETWGPFGRGWVNDRMVAQVTSPVAFPVIAYPGAWAEPTKGPLSTEVVYVPNTVNTIEGFAPYRGKLKGKIVITAPEPRVNAQMTAPGTRYTQEQLNALGNPYPVSSGRQGGGRAGQFGGRGGAGQAGGAQATINLQACLLQEGVAAMLTPGGGNSTGGNVFNGSGRPTVTTPAPIPTVALTPEHYGRIFRILQKGIPVKMDLDVRSTFFPKDTMSFNLIAEIPGTDKSDEVVMLGAHFDSWQGGTGATDNAAGSAVMMEAMRILKTLNLPMRRTVRIGLWTGEEQGLLGSRAYVTEHFGTAGALKPEAGKISAYYNVDNGTGAIRGIYVENNPAVAPIFAQFMRPLNSDSITVGTIAPGITTGTDHQSFDRLGIPGFQFIQDAVEYGTRTHHSSQDVYERVQPVDMKHNAVAVAAFVYLTANRDAMLPRKAAAAPNPNAGGAGRAGGGRGGAGQPDPGCPTN
jgi:hypothetical protein